LARQVSDPPEQDDAQSHPVAPGGDRDEQATLPRASIIICLTLIGLVILSSTGLLIFTLVGGRLNAGASVVTAVSPTSVPTQQSPQSGKSTPATSTTPVLTPSPSPTTTSPSPLFAPDNVAVPPLQLPVNRYVLYETQNNIYLVPATGGQPQTLTTPGYIYNQAVRPILTPSGQLLYAGNGIWMMNIFNGTTTQIATLSANRVITSMSLSSDGTTIAWSTEPANGKGNIDIYAGPLNAPLQVYQQSSNPCPCFRVFGFLNSSNNSHSSHSANNQNNTTLLLTDGQQSHEAIQVGLWALDLTQTTGATPQLLLPGTSTQGPLTLAPYSNVLLYSSFEGNVAEPTDGSVPNDVAALSYPNSLDMTTIDGTPLKLDTTQVLLPEQNDLVNTAEYNWITTPVFTPNGHTLIFVEFSSQSQGPYDRSNAIFSAQISGSSSSLSVGQPQLMETSNARLLELGPWFSSHVLTFYADKALYALDVQSGAVAKIVQTGTYARIIGIVGTGTV
jgi:hypothetical protein